MIVDVNSVARIAQIAARQEVRDAMDAHQRYYPAGEVHEAGIHYAIRNALMAHFRIMPPPRPRVVIEYGRDVIRNLPILPGGKHPFDLAVMYPLAEVALGKEYPRGYAWAPKNCEALGLIEVKKDNTNRLVDDAKLLSSIGINVPGTRPLEWGLLVGFISAKSAKDVNNHEAKIKKDLVAYGFTSLTPCDPREAPAHPGSNCVKERWFDVLCYGKVY